MATLRLQGLSHIFKMLFSPPHLNFPCKEKIQTRKDGAIHMLLYLWQIGCLGFFSFRNSEE